RGLRRGRAGLHPVQVRHEPDAGEAQCDVAEHASHGSDSIIRPRRGLDTLPPMVAHGHDRSTAAARSRSVLLVTLALTGTTMVVEFVAGLWTGSLALLADAG